MINEQIAGGRVGEGKGRRVGPNSSRFEILIQFYHHFPLLY